MGKEAEIIRGKKVSDVAEQAHHGAQTLYTILRDPNPTVKGKYYVSTYSSKKQAQWGAENSMINVESNLRLIGVELNKLKDPVMIIGPTCTLGDSTDTVYPEIDYVFNNLKDTPRLYVVEPSGPYFPSLERYAEALPPEFSRKLVLVNEEAGHLHWNTPKGFEGVPDRSIGFAYSTLTFGQEVMSHAQLQDSISEVGRVLMPGGFFIIDSTSYDNSPISMMLPRNRLELIQFDEHSAHTYIRKLK